MIKNKQGMYIVTCIEDLSVEIRHNSLFRVEKYKKGETYAYTKVTDFSKNQIVEKVGMYDERSTRGLCTITMDLFKKHFVDLTESLKEVNGIFENIMDTI